MKTELIDNELPEEAMTELREAKAVLEHHGIADRLTELLGAPVTASATLPFARHWPNRSATHRNTT